MKYIIYIMTIYYIQVYDWSISLIKTLESWMHNFIWSGDIEKRKLITIACRKCYRPTKVGYLGIKSLSTLNQAANLKLCWDTSDSSETWAYILKGRVLRNGGIINKHHISSSIWSSAKNYFSIIMDNSAWGLGNYKQINFGIDSWCGSPLS